jgi:hypothetical protein
MLVDGIALPAQLIKNQFALIRLQIIENTRKQMVAISGELPRQRRGFFHHTEMGMVNWWRMIRAALAFTICGTRSRHSSCARRPRRLCCGIRMYARPCNCTHIAWTEDRMAAQELALQAILGSGKELAAPANC